MNKIPDYQGMPVSDSVFRLAGASGLSLEGEIAGIDDVIEITLEVKVVGVGHKVHEPSGQLRREHTFKVLDIADVKTIVSSGQIKKIGPMPGPIAPFPAETVSLDVDPETGEVLAYNGRHPLLP